MCNYKVKPEKPQCAMFCEDDRCESGSVCPDTYDANGCPMPRTCAPSVRDYGHYGLDIMDNYTWDQVIEACPKSQYDSSGCPVAPSKCKRNLFAPLASTLCICIALCMHMLILIKQPLLSIASFQSDFQQIYSTIALTDFLVNARYYYGVLAAS